MPEHDTPPALVLASGSPRRRELLRQIGVAFTSVSIDVEEQRRSEESPEAYVQRLALEKAQAGLANLNPKEQAVVLGADTLGVLNGQVLEKPHNQSHAAQMLTSMSGVRHQVLSAVALTDGVKQRLALSTTWVTFREITAAEIERYWYTGEPQDKAGGYAIQGLGAVFVTAIEGSYSSVVGLPLELTQNLLAQYNIPVWGNAASAANVNESDS
ncbi:septum formation inhibitor Maf [Gilvimarinus agarilyticus]|uniref:Maf family protein n=1 Tax=unclassified Gilvimarinus TaxID=2642066 RepID=UPI001C0A229D|nr:MULTISPECIES: Maf family protein [unclassified Gilvimarinus]MBU2885433.1 septum formation inhibitor Maf [Gilvimarinus agarilyticus]MDO6570333.1 Maf family protein [Gilvimarinus sp. 2_MG-2023]MDO6746880.1 Maf family protein [Gilvimarinus sp. 1_MG-2023]